RGRHRHRPDRDVPECRSARTESAQRRTGETTGSFSFPVSRRLPSDQGPNPNSRHRSRSAQTRLLEKSLNVAQLLRWHGRFGVTYFGTAIQRSDETGRASGEVAKWEQIGRTGKRMCCRGAKEPHTLIELELGARPESPQPRQRSIVWALSSVG